MGRATQRADDFAPSTQGHVQAAAQVRVEDRVVECAGELKALIDHGVIAENVRRVTQQQRANRAACYFQRINRKVAPRGVQTCFVSRQVIVVIEQQADVEMVVGQDMAYLFGHGLDH